MKKITKFKKIKNKSMEILKKNNVTEVKIEKNMFLRIFFWFIMKIKKLKKFYIIKNFKR